MSISDVSGFGGIYREITDIAVSDRQPGGLDMAQCQSDDVRQLRERKRGVLRKERKAHSQGQVLGKEPGRLRVSVKTIISVSKILTIMKCQQRKKWGMLCGIPLQCVSFRLVFRGVTDGTPINFVHHNRRGPR